MNAKSPAQDVVVTKCMREHRRVGWDRISLRAIWAAHFRHRNAREPLVKGPLPVEPLHLSSEAVELCYEIACGRDDLEARAFVEWCIRDKRPCLGDGRPISRRVDARYRESDDEYAVRYETALAQYRAARPVPGEWANLSGNYYLELIWDMGSREPVMNADMSPAQYLEAVWQSLDFTAPETDPDRLAAFMAMSEDLRRDLQPEGLRKPRPVPETKYFPSALNRALWVWRVRDARPMSRWTVTATKYEQHTFFMELRLSALQKALGASRDRPYLGEEARRDGRELKALIEKYRELSVQAAQQLAGMGV